MRRFPWWAWALVCGAVFVLATAWSVYTILRWGLAVATNLANIGSFAIAPVALVLALVSLVSQRSRKRVARELAAHILHVDEAKASQPPRVSHLDDKQLGVRPAVDSADFGMTRYVQRDVEASATEAMLDGQMVVFVGSATAGKTRTAVHLVKKLFPDRFLYSPTEITSLSAMLDAGHKFKDAVVWLDDLERYFGENGIDLGTLSRLCPTGRTDVVVVGTLRHKEFLKHNLTSESYKTGDKTAESEPHPAGTALLAHLLKRGRLFKVTSELSPNERTALEAAQATARAGDERLSTAARSGRSFGEYLGAGVEMMSRWTSNGNTLEKVGAAVISAAVDARRAGYSGSIPSTSLAQLASNYLSETLQMRADTPDPEQGMIWAVLPVSGTDTSSCLIPLTDGGYRADDYLADRADTAPSPLAGTRIHESVWQAVLRLADPDQTVSIGYAAYASENHDVAEKAWHRAATSGNANAMNNLGNVLVRRKDFAEAEPWFRKAAEAGDTIAMNNLGNVLSQQGSAVEAENWFHKAIEAGETDAMFNLGLMLIKRGDLEEGKAWYRNASECGDVDAMVKLGILLAGNGDVAEAEMWFHEAVKTGDTTAMNELGILLAERGDFTEAEACFREAVESTHINAMANLGSLMAKLGRLDEAENWLHKAVKNGDFSAIAKLSAVLAKRGGVKRKNETEAN